ncbi:hypothetical protein H9I45_15210 [Polaribacter haliotis]|uniref:YD repeat-containing protein n=1 Tax=Polaribacter haliotis TaxID=1888915 RepID=A0A7L8AF81_9FLAO|nr:hypothetical protein [Polaribacter haliotis]QOD60668.1 hypothetical protein H9I45_15210 [Polaribacter haliotis]
MKKIFLFTLLLCLILFNSCGSSDEDNEMVENLPDVEKLITQITSKEGQKSSFYNPDKFIYENGKLVKAWFYGCSGALYEFEYGSNGKISTVYSQNSVSYSDINTSIKSTGNIIKQIYDSNDRLISLTDSSGKVLASLDYNSEGVFNKIDIKDLIIAKPDTYIFTNFDTNGNPVKNNFGFTYSYDDKINPIYVLFTQFGFFNIEMCNSLDERRVFYISPNNVKEIIDNDNNDEVIFSAIYTYDSDGYPISNSYNSKSGGNNSDVENFSY